MVLRMATSYGPQAAQMNEELSLKSFLDLTLRQHPRDEDPEPWEVRTVLKLNPFELGTIAFLRTFTPWWFCCKSISLSYNEPKIDYEVYYETENTYIFAWFSILGVKHYRWLHGSICWLAPNNKVDYLVCTIRRILYFL
jgi:hypothetical protein